MIFLLKEEAELSTRQELFKILNYLTENDCLIGFVKLSV